MSNISCKGVLCSNGGNGDIALKLAHFDSFGHNSPNLTPDIRYFSLNSGVYKDQGLKYFSAVGNSFEHQAFQQKHTCFESQLAISYITVEHVPRELIKD
jgi:hypothetical protein